MEHRSRELVGEISGGSKCGAICLDILKDQWSPALTLKTALLFVQALVSSLQPDDPQDAVVAQQVDADSALDGLWQNKKTELCQ